MINLSSLMNHVEHEKLTNRRKFHRNLQDRKNITFWNNSCLERNFLTCLSTILQQISPQKPHKSKITRLEKDANPKVNVFNELVPKTLSLQICEVQKSPSKTVSFLFMIILHDEMRPCVGIINNIGSLASSRRVSELCSALFPFAQLFSTFANLNSTSEICRI